MEMLYYRYQYDRPDLDSAVPATPQEESREVEPAARSVSKPRRVPVVRLLLLAVALTAAAMLGGTVARYWQEWSNGSLATAENFYFVSDKLDGALHRLERDGDALARFSFTLQNYAVATHHTPSDISYTCTVTDSADSVVTEVRWSLDGSAAGADGTLTGTLSGQSDRESALVCAIPVSAFGTDGSETLTVTAQANTPYAATLRATVALGEGSAPVVLVVTDPGAKSGAVSVALYNVSGREQTGKLTCLTEALELAVDPTWETQPGADGTLTIPAGGAVSVVFLKRDTTRSFDESSFTFQ